MILIVGLIVQILFAIFFFFLCLAFATGAPFVPSTNKTAKQMILLAQIHQGETVYDLGSGDGRLLFEAAKKGAKQAIGLEINPLLVLLTNIRILFSPYRSVITCSWTNFWTVSLDHCDVAFVYLLPWKMKKLEKKLQKELRSGARVVSNSFIFPNWSMKEKDEKTHVYVFTVS